MASKPESFNLLGRRKYTKDEDMRIWKYVRDRRENGVRLAGNSFWKQMENERVITCRSWMSLRDRYLKHIRPKRLQPNRKLTVLPSSPNKNNGELPSRLENSNCNGPEDQVLQLNSRENGLKETRKNVSSKSENKNGKALHDVMLNKRLIVAVTKEHIRPQPSRKMAEIRESDQASSVDSGQLGQLDHTNSEAAVLEMLILIRQKTKATLPQAFFSLFRTNANVQKAIAFLDDKHDTTNVWSAQEDEVLQGKDAKEVENIIKERGHLAVKERLDFIEQNDIVTNNPE